jgi:hypothetical protein
MAENHISTRPPITRKPHRWQADEDLVARFICHANSTHVLQSLWRGLRPDRRPFLGGRVGPEGAHGASSPGVPLKLKTTSESSVNRRSTLR